MNSGKPYPKDPYLFLQLKGTRGLMVQLTAVFFLAAVVSSGCIVHDDGPGHGRGVYNGPPPGQPQVGVTVASGPVTFSFTNHHRQTVQNYYHDHPPKHWKNKGKGRGRGRGGPPPGLAKKGGLPPGLAKKDVLPPGIQMQGLPTGLTSQLPPPPQGTQYGFHNDQVLMIDVSTRVVLDFINISVSARF